MTAERISQILNKYNLKVEMFNIFGTIIFKTKDEDNGLNVAYGMTSKSSHQPVATSQYTEVASNQSRSHMILSQSDPITRF